MKGDAVISSPFLFLIEMYQDFNHPISVKMSIIIDQSRNPIA